MLKSRKQISSESHTRNARTGAPSRRKPLRLWPGIVAVVPQWLVWRTAPIVIDGPTGAYITALGILVGGLAVLVWWAFFSRAPRFERWLAVVLVIFGMMVTPRFLHESVAKGNYGAQFFFNGIPVLTLAFVVWAVATRHLGDGLRRATMVATILLACGAWTLVRSKGLTGDGFPVLTWRWTQTSEERLLTRADDESGVLLSALPSKATTTEKEVEWPGFRGPNRDGIIPGVRIETDWAASPPVEVWRRPVGPGVSSFAVRGDLLYTQEQRGEYEIVSCYDVNEGNLVWMHRDSTRFWDSHVGAGPRATPAVGEGQVYALGARGTLNALNAESGALVWSRDVATDTEARSPDFGFVCSPLVVGDVVIVHVDKLVAYDIATGEPRWFGPAGSRSYGYSSPQLLTIDGVPQVVLLRHAGLISVTPAEGMPLWKYPCPGLGIMQPVLTAAGDLLISMVDFDTAAPLGTRRIAISQQAESWSVEERWTSTGLKPTFNPVVVHQGHAFGFDRRILACIDLEDGTRKWKGGRYGSGQLLLLPEQDLLLVVSEYGEVALLEAVPDRFNELARFAAIEGRTWNQPALIGNLLLVRNSQEMAAFRLSLAGR